MTALPDHLALTAAPPAMPGRRPAMTAGAVGEGTKRAAAGAALLLAALIFVADLEPDLMAAVSILYIAVLVLGSWRRGKVAVIGWTLGCAALASAAFVTVHGSAWAWPSILRLLFSLFGLAITSALVLSRIALQSARAAQQASERDMQNFANSVPQILWRGYSDGSCDYINDRFEELTGLSWPPGERERHWADAVHPDDRDTYLRALMRGLAERREIRLTFRLRSADGGYRHVINVARPAPDPRDPTRIAYYGGISDATAEYAAREQARTLTGNLEQRVEERTAALARSERRFRSLFYDMKIAFAETDTRSAKALLACARMEGATDFQRFANENPALIEHCLAEIKLVHMNDTVAHMLGYANSAEVLRLSRADFVEDPRLALMTQLEAIFQERRRTHGSTTFIRKDGSRIPVAYQVNYPSDWTYGLVTYVDISEQQRAHELVLAANEELARANRAATMGALSASLAHELNQPMTALTIDTGTCLRLLQMDPPDVEQGMRAVERLSRNVDRVNGIVRRTRAQLVKGRKTIEPVDLCDLARETQVLLLRDLGNRGATLRIGCAADLPSVAADRVELQQVLVNLIINAADAMTAVDDRERLVELLVERASDEDVAVSVSDRGPGISPDERARIFRPFYTTKPDGMGMGLQICRSLVESFGGMLSVDDREGGGATFRFTLPIATQV